MGVCDVPVISTVCDTAGEAAASLVSAPFDWLASAMGQAAGWLFEAVWTVFDTTTLVDVTSDEYVAVYNRSEEHTSELQSRENLVCRLLLEKKKKKKKHTNQLRMYPTHSCRPINT